MTVFDAPQTPSWTQRHLPGLGLTFGIAAVAMAAQRLSGIPALSPLAVAMVLGTAAAT